MTIVSVVATTFLLAQNGGKAEPKRIEFTHGRTSTALSETRVFSEEAGIETELDSSRTFSLALPADGDYLLYVRKKMVKRPRQARFSISLSIKYGSKRN